MNPLLKSALSLAPILAVTASASAQSNIDPTSRFAWAENVGWTNWRHDTPAPGNGVFVHDSFLEGFLWGENIGWINVGDGTPGSVCGGRPCYANVNGSDVGVNLRPSTGALSGLAWSENVGWINFAGGATASPPNPARLDPAACRLRGFAWGENVGWINLDHAVHFVALAASECCEPCDLNCDGSLNSFDIQPFIDVLTGGGACSPCAGDASGDGSVNGFDIQPFIDCLSG